MKTRKVYQNKLSKSMRNLEETKAIYQAFVGIYNERYPELTLKIIIAIEIIDELINITQQTKDSF